MRLLDDRGYAAMSVEHVASTAQVAKSAIYRRWASKAEMVFALVVHGDAIEPPADQGTLAADLEALSEHVLKLLSAPAAREALPGLLADLRGDPRLADRFQALFVEAERRLVTALLERAVLRGEFKHVPDVVDAHAQLLGTAFAWVFLLADAPPPDLARRISTSVLATLQT